MRWRLPLRLMGPPKRRTYWRHHQDFDTARGAVVGMWAGIESGIDQANHAGWVLTNRDVSTVIPQNFDRKVALFKKLHRDTPPFAFLANDAMRVLSRIRARLQDRHFLVHGYHVPNEADLDGWLVRRHRFRKDGGLDVAERRFSCDELSQIRRDLIEIQNDCAGYLKALHSEIAKEWPETRA